MRFPQPLKAARAKSIAVTKCATIWFCALPKAKGHLSLSVVCSVERMHFLTSCPGFWVQRSHAQSPRNSCTSQLDVATTYMSWLPDGSNLPTPASWMQWRQFPVVVAIDARAGQLMIASSSNDMRDLGSSSIACFRIKPRTPLRGINW